jgi:hypothetical protein
MKEHLLILATRLEGALATLATSATHLSAQGLMITGVQPGGDRTREAWTTVQTRGQTRGRGINGPSSSGVITEGAHSIQTIEVVAVALAQEEDEVMPKALRCLVPIPARSNLGALNEAEEVVGEAARLGFVGMCCCRNRYLFIICI